MPYLVLFLAVVAAALLWSAALTAAAARVARPWLRRLMVAMAVLAPVLALLPWLAMSFLMAFAAKLQVNWFGPMLTAWLSAAIGGASIVRAGLGRGSESPAPSPAARWPLVPLCTAFLVAKVMAGGTLAVIDTIVTGQAAGIRTEAVALMQANLPPVVTEAANAASRYEAAFATIDADPVLQEKDSPLGNAATVDARDPAVADLVARHGETLDLVREAAGHDVCRFARDWTRPSIDMLLPEMQSIRQAARLAQLAARRRAATGDVSGALDDVTVLHRMGQHAAAEPILISGLVGVAIDTMALNTFAEVLPTVGEADVDRLDDPAIHALVHVVPSFKRHFFGEEAFGTMMFASLCDGASAMDPFALFTAIGSSEPPFIPSAGPLKPIMGTMFRVFLLPEDLRVYRATLRAYQRLLCQPRAFADNQREAKAIEDKLTGDRRGIVTAALAPALSGCIRTGVRAQALHRAAAVAVAATRHRIETGRLPESLEDLVPTYLPLAPTDPFTTDATLRIRRADGDATLLIYSIGPNGEDDGGPLPPGAEPAAANDDVGLRLGTAPVNNRRE